MDQNPTDSEAIAVIRPKYPLPLIIARSIFALAIGLIFAGPAWFMLRSGAMENATCTSNGREVPCPQWFPYIFIGIGLLIMFAPLVVILMRKIMGCHTYWAIYKDKVVYAQGLLNQERRTMPREQVTGLSMTRSLAQRMFGLGTVVIETPFVEDGFSSWTTGSNRAHRQGGLHLNTSTLPGVGRLTGTRRTGGLFSNHRRHHAGGIRRPIGVRMKDIETPDKIFDLIKKTYEL